MPLSGPEPDSIQILQFLEAARASYMQSPLVREKTVSLLYGLGNNDLTGQATRVTEFVRSRVVYVRDPQGGEYVISPIRMLELIDERGTAAGDCDDHVMLLNTMLGSIGFEAKFAGVKIQGSSTYNHVISLVKFGPVWVQIDPCVKSGRPYHYDDLLTL